MHEHGIPIIMDNQWPFAKLHAFKYENSAFFVMNYKCKWIGAHTTTLKQMHRHAKEMQFFFTDVTQFMYFLKQVERQPCPYDTCVLSDWIAAGTLGRITIHPGRTMKVIGTVTGPLKRYVGQ